MLVPGAAATSDDVERVASLARACGARVVMMDADAHDRAVAGVSHLPLIVAAALVEAVAGTDAAPRADWPVARDLAATGWRDMTRLARGDTVMGAAIAATNAQALAGRLRDLRAILDDVLAELERPGGPDEDCARSPAPRGARAARRAVVTEELVYVVPRRAVPDEAGWYGIRTDGLEAFIDAARA